MYCAYDSLESLGRKGEGGRAVVAGMIIGRETGLRCRIAGQMSIE